MQWAGHCLPTRQRPRAPFTNKGQAAVGAGWDGGGVIWLDKEIAFATEVAPALLPDRGSAQEFGGQNVFCPAANGGMFSEPPDFCIGVVL